MKSVDLILNLYRGPGIIIGFYCESGKGRALFHPDAPMDDVIEYFLKGFNLDDLEIGIE